MSQRIVFALFQCQPRILGITLQNPTLFHAASDAMAEGVSERIQLIVSGCLDTMEALLAIVIFGIDTIEKLDLTP
ncbi:hypothetical protein VAWG001_24250 [Aeromonas dhakensis]|nr:hypothetical protein VAWG001_24250 [Aeromonas dhakensis]